MEQTNKKKRPFYKKVWFYFLAFIVLLGFAGLFHDNDRAANLKYKIEFRSFRDDSDMPCYKDRPDEATLLYYFVIFNQDFTKEEALAIADSMTMVNIEYNNKKVYSHQYTFLVDTSLDLKKATMNEDKQRGATYYNGVLDSYSDRYGVPVD